MPGTGNPGWWIEHLRIYTEALWGGRGLSKPSSSEELARAEAHPRQSGAVGGVRASKGKGNGEGQDKGTPHHNPYRRIQQSDELRPAHGEQTDEKLLDTENRMGDHGGHGEE